MRLNIGTKISLFTFIAGAVSILTISFFSVSYFRSNYIRAVEQEVSAIGRTAEINIEDSLSLGFELHELAGVSERLRDISNRYDDIHEAHIVDKDGKIVFSSNPGKINRSIIYEDGEGGEVLPDGNIARTVNAAGKTYYEITINIEKNGNVVGELKIDISDEVVAERTSSVLTVFIIVSVVVLFSSVAISFFVGKQIASPIKALSGVAMEMAKGNLSIRATPSVKDEVGSLSENFNHMAERISADREQLAQNVTDLQKLLKLKTDFIHILDHQLRTPLSVMNGYLELWRTGQYIKFSPEKQEDIKKKIITANDQLSSIIHSMIGALEVEGGISDIHPEIFNLGDLIKEIYETDFADECAKKGLKCSIDVSAAPNISSDRRYVSAVIMNIIDNAVKYTSAGDINLRAYPEGPNAVITLTDTGIGLTESDMTGLFQKFTRGEMASKLSPGGSGIGLYVVKQILNALNGDIQAISKGRNQGTTFIIKIPIKE